ncbi:hypothetical protein DID76_04690, partial [Candidatus Marinamargulisbacteria bacterium SCGC AG-414-C22]
MDLVKLRIKSHQKHFMSIKQAETKDNFNLTITSEQKSHILNESKDLFNGENHTDFCLFSSGMTAMVYYHPNYPNFIFKKLSHSKAKAEYDFNQRVYALIMGKKSNTIKVPKASILKTTSSVTWLIQEKLDLISDEESEIFYEVCDQLLIYYDNETVNIGFKKNFEETIKNLFLVITKTGYWDVNFPNFPNICSDGKIGVIDFGIDESKEYTNHQEEAILSLAEIFCSPKLLTTID